MCNAKLFLQWTFHFADNDVPRQALSTEATHNPEDHNQNKTDKNLMLQVTIRNSKYLRILAKRGDADLRALLPGFNTKFCIS